MAKLARDRSSYVSTIRTDTTTWDPPVRVSNHQTNNQSTMLPPLSRPKVPQNVPNTPNLQRGQETPAQSNTHSSKKRRARNRKKNKNQDSFSEHNTSVSGEPSSTTKDRENEIKSELRTNSNNNTDVYVPLKNRFKSVQDERQERLSRSSQQQDNFSPVRPLGSDLIKQEEDVLDTVSQSSSLHQTMPTLPVRVNVHHKEKQVRKQPAENPPGTNGSSQSQRPKNRSKPQISSEQQAVFDKEPEMFGVYAASDEESDNESVQQEVKMEDHDEQESDSPSQEFVPGTIENQSQLSSSPSEDHEPTSEDRRQPSNSQSEGSIPTAEARDQVSNPLSKDLMPAAEETRVETEDSTSATPPISTSIPQVVSNVVIPPAPRLSNGRFSCPFAAAYDCDKTFQRAKSAMRHADSHVNSDRYKCSICDKGFAREDSYSRHVKGHGKETGKTKKSARKKAPTIQTSTLSNQSNGDLNSAEDDMANGSVYGDHSTDQSAAPFSINRESHEAESLPVTSTEEETENDIAADDQAMKDEQTVVVNMTSSSQNIPAATRSSRGLKRKQPSPSPQRSKEDSPKPRKRNRRNSDDLSTHQQISEQLTRTLRSNRHVSAETESSPEPQIERQNDDYPVSDTEMKDIDEEGSPSQIEQNDASDRKSDPPRESPKIQVIVPVLEPEESDEFTVIANSKSKTNMSKPTTSATLAAKKMSRNRTLDGFISRSATRSASTEGPPRRTQTAVQKSLAITETGESSNSRAQKEKVQTTITSNARGDPRKGNSVEKNEEPDDAVESGTNSEDRPKATTVARRGPTRKGNARLVSARNNGKGNEDEDSRSDNDNEDSNSSSASENPYKRNFKKTTKRKSQAPKGTRTGRFDDEEIANLHAWRDSFCDLHSMDVYSFNEMMTASTKRQAKGEEWRPYQNFITKREFMDQYYEQLPDRDRRAMHRFRERHFVNVDKTAWTKEDDQELKRLVKECGTKWVEIGELMGRTSDSVNQRWRHKLNYGDKVADGEWTEKETDNLSNIVAEMADKQGKDPDESDVEIKWTVVSKKLGTGRTAQQCSNRWRILTHRRTNKGFVRVPHADRIPLLTAGPRTPSRMAKRLTPKKTSGGTSARTRQTTKVKSAEFAKDSEDDNDGKVAASVNENDEEAEISDNESNAEESKKDGSDDGNSSENESTSDEDDSDAESAEEDDEDANVTSGSDDKSKNPTGVSPSRKRKLDSSASEEISKSSQTAKTPKVSRRPFKTNTPANEPSLTQLYALTQLDEDTPGTSRTRQTTGKRSRVPDTEIRPERPSPSNSVRRKPISSPLEMLAQAAANQQAADQADEQSSDSDSDADSDSSSEADEALTSSKTFASAKSKGNEEHDEDTESETDSDSRNSSGSSSSSRSRVNNSKDDSTDDSDNDSKEVEDSDDEEAESNQHQAESTQGGFWESVNNFRSMLPFSQKSSSSQQAARPTQKGRKSQIMKALRGSPIKEDSSDDE